MPVGDATAHLAPGVCVGVSLKMYFGYQQTLDWCRRVADLARHHQAVRSGAVELFVLPSFPALAPVLADLAGTGVGTGAQNLSSAASGAFTGEVSGAFLAEMGCRYVEVGHAERRRLFGETDEVVAAKTRAALDAGLCPVICVGESTRTSPEQAAAACVEQLDRLLSLARSADNAGPGRSPRIIVAYEPVWAIGAAQPAPTDHIRSVCTVLQKHLHTLPEYAGSRVIYGGSAGPGLLTHLGGAVSGLFLGRFAHDPAALKSILDEAARHPDRATDPAG
ncbi:triosephosphate isomerase [Micromonospora pallida]|uniref:Triosephosphate isomerase n=1 Tax=Micromonospora pallida TaxID=145854 RepID=A0A1C6SHH6_9ACTN|nr:triose-phosphate isomerase family protein [Micromonospora pallida]SCL28946.1 triosephosphate isomerase [Micromonospora pallida]